HPHRTASGRPRPTPGAWSGPWLPGGLDWRSPERPRRTGRAGRRWRRPRPPTARPSRQRPAEPTPPRSHRTSSRCRARSGRSSRSLRVLPDLRRQPPHGVRVRPRRLVVVPAQPDDLEAVRLVEPDRGLVVGAHFQEGGGLVLVGPGEQGPQQRFADPPTLVRRIDTDGVDLRFRVRGPPEQRQSGISDEPLLFIVGTQVVVPEVEFSGEGLLAPRVVLGEEHLLQLGAALDVPAPQLEPPGRGGLVGHRSPTASTDLRFPGVSASGRRGYSGTSGAGSAPDSNCERAAETSRAGVGWRGCTGSRPTASAIAPAAEPMPRSGRSAGRLTCGPC